MGIVMVDNLPQGDTVVNMFTSGALKFEAKLNGEIYITDMLDRKKYQLNMNVRRELILILVEQE